MNSASPTPKPGRIGLAFKFFIGILFGSIATERAQAALTSTPSAPAPTEPKPAAPSPPAAAARPSQPRRSEAITLLAALQREARFVDLVQEPLQQYTDQQIGAAARDVLRDCQSVLQRFFALVPVLNAAENATVDTPETIPTGRLMITGKPAGSPPFRGRLVHHGWEASQVQLPDWTGDANARNVVAPAEIEC